MKSPVEQQPAILEWLVKLVELEIVAHVFEELYHAISNDDARLISFSREHGVILKDDYVLEYSGGDMTSWYLTV
ncbi:unnamed protein product [Aphanomyces euteiches]